MALRHETFSLVSSLKILHLINSIILSYLIISFYNEEFDPGSG